MLTIGLTGGIGSGKSAASAIFESYGINIVDADIVAREVVEPGKTALSLIAEHFGEQILNDEQALNRGKLREIIFSDPDEKTWLETLLHPIIRDEIIQQLHSSDSEYTILVSPLLFETDQNNLVKRALLIDVSVETQIERATKRDNTNSDQIRKIIANQYPRKIKLEKADDIIENNLSLQALETRVHNQHKIYLELAREQALDS